uniref:Uncharacterized protein n=1 Tax=Meloidogyne hapla TaxID=6305 RepID=A0A1I8BUH3_MELHA
MQRFGLFSTFAAKRLFNSGNFIKFGFGTSINVAGNEEDVFDEDDEPILGKTNAINVNFTDGLVKHILREFQCEQKHHLKEVNEPIATLRLRDVVEKAKNNLSVNDQTEVNIPYFSYNGYSFSAEYEPLNLQLKISHSKPGYEKNGKELLADLYKIDHPDDPSKTSYRQICDEKEKIFKELLLTVLQTVRIFYAKVGIAIDNTDVSIKLMRFAAQFHNDHDMFLKLLGCYYNAKSYKQLLKNNPDFEEMKYYCDGVEIFFEEFPKINGEKVKNTIHSFLNEEKTKIQKNIKDLVNIEFKEVGFEEELSGTKYHFNYLAC